MKTTTIYINNQPVTVPMTATVLEACSEVGVEISRFCFHNALSIAGNCRMCLVEVEKSPKPVASCALPVMPGLKVFTDTPLVKKAKENIIELLLINHPLDCPICDQGGECDLQEQALTYGSDRSRFTENKRGVEDKNCGPLIKTIMTRCIHCTRCVRFATEIAGVPDMGTTSRGQTTEIGFFVEKVLQTELSGNLVDLCPVGALTSKPYSFTVRPWDLRSVESLDILDGFGSNLRIDVKDSEIVRILPKKNQDLNQEWITDQIRFSYDGLQRNRLFKPFLKVQDNWTVKKWKESIQFIQNNLKKFKPSEIGIVMNSSLDSETVYNLKKFASTLQSNILMSDRIFSIRNDFQNDYICKISLHDIKKYTLCYFISFNPKLEASILKIWLQQNAKLTNLSVGCSIFSTLSTKFVGITPLELSKLLKGNQSWSKSLGVSKNVLFFYGSSLLERSDGLELQKVLVNLFPKLKFVKSDSVNFISSEANQVGFSHLGIQGLQPSKFKTLKFLYLCQPMKEFFFFLDEMGHKLQKKFEIVYQHHHVPLVFLNPKQEKQIDWIQNKNTILLPGSCFLESVGSYFNFEDRLQKTAKVFTPSQKNQFRENQQIALMLNKQLSTNFDKQNVKDVFLGMLENDHLTGKKLSKSTCFQQINNLEIKCFKTAFKPFVNDPYLDLNLFQNSSVIMTRCAKQNRRQGLNFPEKRF